MSSLVLQQFERGPVNWVKIESYQLTETVQCAQDKLLGGKEEGGGRRRREGRGGRGEGGGGGGGGGGKGGGKEGWEREERRI